jgi:5-methylcytosine-specific restriction enzyme subunit McrC
MNSPTVLTLTEYASQSFPRDALPEEVFQLLWEHYSTQVEVEPPSFKTGNQWRLMSKGWVGHLPVSEDLGFNLLAKVPLANLFGMYEYAYRLKSFRFLEGMVGADSLKEFYEQLASVLARKVLDRARRGFYRAYINEQDQLPYVRGRMDMARALRSPWDTRLHCHYEDHTYDVDENQILAWTLWTIVRSGLCGGSVVKTVRQAYRTLQGTVALQPFNAQACVGRLYNRLNQDYHPMHALSRFFLEQTGPSHTSGDRQMIPFLVDMARLYELFVAEWLRKHLPAPWTLEAQTQVPIGRHDSLYWNLDLIIAHVETGQVRWILDTKYKRVDAPSTDDIAQVVAYAQAKGCQEAVLIYPVQLAHPLDEFVGDIRVRTLCFALDGDLEAAGRQFLAMLGMVTPYIADEDVAYGF